MLVLVIPEQSQAYKKTGDWASTIAFQMETDRPAIQTFGAAAKIIYGKLYTYAGHGQWPEPSLLKVAYGIDSRVNLGVTGAGVTDRLTLNAEVVNERSHLTVRVDGYVEAFMDHEVISRSLADDFEIVYKRFLETHLAIEPSLCHACRLVFVTCGKSCAANSLRLEVELAMETTFAVDRSDEQEVQCPTKLDEFSRTARRAGNEHKYFRLDSNVVCDRGGFG